MIAIALSAYRLFDLDHYLTLKGIKNAQAQLETWRQGSPLFADAAFFLIYIAVTAFSLSQGPYLVFSAG